VRPHMDAPGISPSARRWNVWQVTDATNKLSFVLFVLFVGRPGSVSNSGKIAIFIANREKNQQQPLHRVP
jgi:hypothetical protein